MPTLLRPWKRTPSVHNGAEPKTTRQRKSGSPEPRDLLLLVPSGGGLSFEMLAFAGEQSAAAHLAGMRLPPGSKPGHVAFRALHSPAGPAGTAEPLEAVVLVRDPRRPGVVDLYSFVDMDSANAFVTQEARHNLDLYNVLMFWAAPVDLTSTVLDLPVAPPEDTAEAPLPTVSIPLPPRPTGPTARPRKPARASAPAPAVPQPFETAEDGRARVHVTSQGAAFEPEAPAPPPEPAQAQPRTGIMAEVQAWGGWDGLAPLIVSSALANPQTYDQFGHDPFATGRARLIVAMGAIAAVIGSINSGFVSSLAHLPAFALGWCAFAFAIYSFGTQAFPGQRGKDTFRRLVHALALATSPALLLVIGIVPTYGPLFVLGAYIWVLLTTTTAISGTLELNRESSLVVATVGCLALFTISQVAPLILV